MRLAELKSKIRVNGFICNIATTFMLKSIDESLPLQVQRQLVRVVDHQNLWHLELDLVPLLNRGKLEMLLQVVELEVLVQIVVECGGSTLMILQELKLDQYLCCV